MNQDTTTIRNLLNLTAELRRGKAEHAPDGFGPRCAGPEGRPEPPFSDGPRHECRHCEGRPPFDGGHRDMPPPPQFDAERRDMPRPPFGDGPRKGMPHMGGHRVLAVLYDGNDGISQNKLAELLRIRKQSLSEVLMRMEDHDLIMRTPNENDRRESLVYLSDKGKEKAEAQSVAQEQEAQRILSVLTDEERAQLSSILQKLADANKPTNGEQNI